VVLNNNFFPEIIPEIDAELGERNEMQERDVKKASVWIVFPSLLAQRANK
jgi:hypothetical protein